MDNPNPCPNKEEVTSKNMHIHCGRVESMKINDLQYVLNHSDSWLSALRKVYLTSPHASHYDQLKQLVIDYKLNTSSFGKRTKSKLNSKNLTFDEYIKSDMKHQNTVLKRKLIEEGRDEKCEECGRNDGLQLDHINGRNRDHRKSNLRLLCAVCHMKTHTYSGKNRRKVNEFNFCLICDHFISSIQDLCQDCVKCTEIALTLPIN